MPALLTVRTTSVLCLLTSVFAAGCQGGAAPVAAPGLQPAPVSQPVVRDVTDYMDFTGRADAVQAVDVRARVTGFLVRMPFKEGDIVRGDQRPTSTAMLLGLLAEPLGWGPLLAGAALCPGQFHEGDLLFEIDPRPYEDQLDYAISQVTLNEASLKLAETTYERDKVIANSVPGGVSKQQLDQDAAAVAEAKARVDASVASTKIYRLNLSFTKVRAPIDGQVSRYYLTRGNVVNQDQTLLTTVVSLDPMYGYFDMDEPTLIRIRMAVNQGRIKRHQEQAVPILMGLQGEEGYPHKGSLNYINNQVSPGTGSISVRGIFDNPLPPGGTRLMSPGMFLRIRLPIGQKHPERLVIDRAIRSDQGQKSVYVLDADNKVQYRRVTTGPLQDDGLRVISQGLKADDWVVVGGLQQVKPGMTIRPQKVTMPTIGPSVGIDGQAAEPK